MDEREHTLAFSHITGPCCSCVAALTAEVERLKVSQTDLLASADRAINDVVAQLEDEKAALTVEVEEWKGHARDEAEAHRLSVEHLSAKLAARDAQLAEAVGFVRELATMVHGLGHFSERATFDSCQTPRCEGVHSFLAGAPRSQGEGT